MRSATLMVGAVGVMVAVLGFAQTATWAQTGISAPSTSLLRDASEGVYAVPQAARGKSLFAKECVVCHSDDPSINQVESGGARGYWLGDRRGLSVLVGERFLAKYRTAGDLYTKMRRTQPPDNAGGLSPQAYADILAYLLQVSGLPPGSKELPGSFAALKSVTLNERGFVPIFNGTDFTGIGFVLGSNCKPRPQGCARTERGTTFRVENGELVSTGSPWGYWYRMQKYLNFTLRFDYKWVRPRDDDPDEPFFGNSGYLLFITDHQVWPKSIEIQGRERDITADILLRASGIGAQVTAQDDPDARARAWKPTGEWNSVEIVSRDGKIASYLNQILISTVTEHEFKAPGYVGFQSEGSEIHWRNIRIKAE